MTLLTRRALIGGATAGAGALLAGCDTVGNWAPARRLLFSGEKAHRTLQRALGDPHALAPEYARSQMSPVFRSNGTRDPNNPAYNALRAGNFADWRLQVGGLVRRPLSLSLDQLRALPARAQITRHDCVEGWSAIGKWQGPMLGTILHGAGLLPSARYIVFQCADLYGPSTPYYESIDLVDAWHPQTILAYALNDRLLDVAHGAPLRLRVERQLGYKHAKYLMRVEAVDDLARVGRGQGGYWEDWHDYDWYAGI